MSILSDLKQAKRLIKNSINELTYSDEEMLVPDLINTLLRIEDQYYDWCEEIDNATGQLRGTTYEHGTSMEFYIESLDWHDVSLILRKLDKRNEPRR